MAITVVGTAQTIASATLALPSGIQAGDTIILAIGVSGGSTAIAGYTEIGEASNPHIMYKMSASGSEGTSIAVGFTARACNAIVLRGVDTSVPVEYVNRTSDLNPPSITPSWGNTEVSGLLAIAYGANQSIGLAITGYPTGYTDNQSAANGDRGSGNYAFMAIGLKVATVASDDPSAFTLNQADGGSNARTIAVKAGASAPAQSGNFFQLMH